MEHTKTPDINSVHTHSDYQTNQWNERTELIDGKIFRSTTNPGLFHQTISQKLHLALGNYFRNSSRKVFFTPFEVKLLRIPISSSGLKLHSVVQPDLCVCQNRKLDELGCTGAPELVVDILRTGHSKVQNGSKV
ncbi:Uma2 family endonuclease [Dyadobacter crusticola]|uniref:Uma2 family endonuclease n=1 Tax=Dyadobacter crusticola TaxID=292407 RepID=UPI0006909342